MSERVIIEKTKLTDLADSIRDKSGETRKLTLEDLKTAVDGLRDDQSIALLTNTATEYNNETITGLREHAFYGNSALKTVKLPALTTLGAYCFAYSGITSIQTGKIETIAAGAFMGTQIQDATEFIANATKIEDYAFQNSQIGGTIELGPNIKTFGSNVFSGTQMEELIFNNSRISPYFVFGYFKGEKLTTVKLKNTDGIYSSKKDIGTPKLSKVWISDTVAQKYHGGTGGLFWGAPSDLQIYVEGSAVSSSWPADWDMINASTRATIHYNVTEEEFDKL